MAGNSPKRRLVYRGSTHEPLTWAQLETLFDAVFGKQWHNLSRCSEAVDGVNVSWVDAEGNEHQASHLEDLKAAYKLRTTQALYFHGNSNGIYCDFEYSPRPPHPKGILALEGSPAVVDRLMARARAMMPLPFEGRLIFLSWGGAKSQRVAEVMQRLLQKQLPSTEVFLSSTSIDPGDDPLRRMLEDGLLKASALIAVLTQEASQRPWVIWETASAWAREQLVIPVFVDVRPQEVPGPLVSKVQGVHLADRKKMDDAFRIVADRLGVTGVQPITDQQFADLLNAAATVD